MKTSKAKEADWPVACIKGAQKKRELNVPVDGGAGNDPIAGRLLWLFSAKKSLELDGAGTSRELAPSGNEPPYTPIDMKTHKNPSGGYPRVCCV